MSDTPHSSRPSKAFNKLTRPVKRLASSALKSASREQKRARTEEGALGDDEMDVDGVAAGPSTSQSRRPLHQSTRTTGEEAPRAATLHVQAIELERMDLEQTTSEALGLDDGSTRKETALNALKISLEMTEGIAKACKCEPLEGTVGLLLKALERFEVSEDVQEDLPLIARRVRNMAALLQAYMEQQRNQEVLDFMESLTSTMEVVLGFVQKKMNRTAIRRIWHGPDDAKDIVRILRILGDTANDFTMESNRNIDTQVKQALQDLKMLELPFTEKALYRSILDNTGCTAGTRVSVLAELADWVTAPTADVPPVCWLNGHAGSGKTTIILTMCGILKRSGLLGGSFFCSREDEQRRSMTNIIPTLAQQLAMTAPTFRTALTSAMEGHKGVGSFTPQDQFDVLLAKPARAAFSGAMRSRVIIIDALDECDNIGDVTLRFLQVISKNAHRIGIRFLIASRPEPRFFDSFKQGEADWSTSLHLQDVPVETAQNDVLTFLNSELSRFSRQNPRRTWPTQHQLQRLATHSVGFFIYASTAWKFASDSDCLNPRNRLQEVLDSRTVPTENNVEQLYALVLGQLRKRKTNSEWNITVPCLEAVICLAVPLTVNELANLLGTEESDIRSILIGLQSVIRLPHAELAEPVVIHHASFADYLFSNRSSGMPWHVDAEKAHEGLHRQCWRLMRQHLSFNVSKGFSSHLENDKQPNIPHLSGELVYACRYWVYHLSRFRPSHSCMKNLLALFPLRFLYLLEVLSVTNHANETQAMLSTLWLCMRKLIDEVRDRKAIAKDASGDEQLQADDADDHAETAMELERLAHEARRFVVAHATPIAVSAPHIYISALTSLDDNSMLKKAVGRHFGQMPTIMTQQAQWTVAVLTMRGHSKTITSVALSPDGKRIASGSWDQTIRMWDTKTGTQVGQPLEGHSGWITSVVFSPDGKRIASGSRDRTIRMWDTETGVQVSQPLEGHSGSISFVAFSPDGKCIASGSDDRTIRMWDTETGMQVGQPLEGHSGSISFVAFSPDGKCIASGSWDRTIRMWDTETGAQVGQLLEGHSKSIISVAFSPDGKRIASGSYDCTIRMWDTETSAQVGQPLEGHSHWINSVVFSPDGKRIASGSWDCTIRMWDTDTGAQVCQPLEGHSHWISSVAFSPDGKRIASGSYDRTIRMWDTETGVQAGQPLEGHSNSIISVAFSPDGKRFASGSDDRTIRVADRELAFDSTDGLRYPEHSGTSEFDVISVNTANAHLQLTSSVSRMEAPATLDPSPFYTFGLPQRPNLRLDEEGWIRGSEDELIFWVLPEYRRGLWWPGMSVLIGAHPVRIDLGRCSLGEGWKQCFTP